MSTARLRRLASDYESVRRLVRNHPCVDIDGVQGNPPERYRLVLTARSLRERGGDLVAADKHLLEIILGQGYPRDAPLLKMLTPVFHPNIAPHAVCIGDHWTASEALDQLIQRVGEMLAYQSYNIKSPLNGRAAQWVTENPDHIPTDRSEFFVDLSDAAKASQAVAAARCSNCVADLADLRTCSAGHAICADCSKPCASCGALLCLTCGTFPCPTCSPA